jgi:hypothetical protein
MAALTSRRSPDAPDGCWHVYFGDVRVGTIAMRGELLKRQRRLILRPVDDLEKHSPLDHFGLEIGRVLFPVRCLATRNLVSPPCALVASSDASAARTASYIMVRLSFVNA